MPSFPHFANLPAEIQLQIWESTPATLPSMHMHMFDVRAPSPSPGRTTSTTSSAQKLKPRQRSSSRGNRVRKSAPSPPRRNAVALECLESVCLEALNTTKGVPTEMAPPPPPPPPSSSPSLLGSRAKGTRTRTGTRFRADPSMYRLRDALRATCTDAAATVIKTQNAIPAADRATVELPSGQRVVYNNARDVLHLRFLTGPPKSCPSTCRGGSSPDAMEGMEQTDGNTTATSTTTSRNTSSHTAAAPLSSIFQSLWSPSLAAALYNSRRIAIDVSQIWPNLAEDQHRLVQDIVFLACTVQNDLEVLYLVDYSAGIGANHARAAKDLMEKNDNGLCRRLHHDWETDKMRKGDVIEGVGMTWREVFGLEKLGWHERHPGFVFGEIFDEVVRLQQANWYGKGNSQATFKGVRVLVAEDEMV